MSVMEFYWLPEIYRALDLNGGEQVAILFSHHGTLDARLYEARARNLGLDHKVFTHTEAAMRWLMHGRSHLPISIVANDEGART
jgi:hypothetical protein